MDLGPIFIGLIVAMLVLLVKFGKELLSLLMGVFGFYEHDTIISILTLGACQGSCRLSHAALS